eukprot:scaffold225280_cov15-Tisochrysis_lutea.AAC.2
MGTAFRAPLSTHYDAGGHLGWIDLSPAGGGWRGRPWTEDVMFDYLQAVLAQERNACNNG